MTCTTRILALALPVALALLADAGRAAAQGVVVAEYCPPTVRYYAPVRVVQCGAP